MDVKFLRHGRNFANFGINFCRHICGIKKFEFSKFTTIFLIKGKCVFTLQKKIACIDKKSDEFYLLERGNAREHGNVTQNSLQGTTLQLCLQYFDHACLAFGFRFL